MKIIFKERFNKEAKLISSVKVRREIIELIDIVETVNSTRSIPGIKQLRHYPNAYRIIVAADFRVVAHYDGDETFTFISIMHRRNVYRVLYFLR